MVSIPERGRSGPGSLSGIQNLMWRAGRFMRDFAAGTMAPVVGLTEWRRRRLLILGYHGVSIEDEHLWEGTIYTSVQGFRRRLEILQKTKCNVLPLGLALRQLDEGTLPPRAVVLAFDDGFHDFASVTAPMLAEFGYQATVFVSSYYAQFNRPIFDVMVCYLLWKGADKMLVLPGILETPVKLDLEGQAALRERLQTLAFEAGLSGWDKDKLLGKLAYALGIDYEHICRQRLLHMMNAEELRSMHAAGHDIQLHTHRHRVSRRRELFEREIRDNRDWIKKTIDGEPLVHMSFPGDVWEPVDQQWLTELGIQTATTCRPAMVTVRSDKLLLPRFMDNHYVPERVFRAWLAGSMELFPKGSYQAGTGQILEDTVGMKVEEGVCVADRDVSSV